MTPAESLQEALASTASEVLRAAARGAEPFRHLLDRPGDLLPALDDLVPEVPSWEQVAVVALVNLCHVGNTTQDLYRFEARSFPATDGWAPAIGVVVVPKNGEAGVAPPAAVLQVAVFADGGSHGLRLHLTDNVNISVGSGVWTLRLTGDAGAGVDIPLEGAWSHEQAGQLTVAATYQLPSPALQGTRIDLGAAKLDVTVKPSAPTWSLDLRLDPLQAAIADDLLGDLRTLLHGAVAADLPRFDYAPKLHVDSNPNSTTLVLG